MLRQRIHDGSSICGLLYHRVAPENLSNVHLSANWISFVARRHRMPVEIRRAGVCRRASEGAAGGVDRAVGARVPRDRAQPAAGGGGGARQGGLPVAAVQWQH